MSNNKDKYALQEAATVGGIERSRSWVDIIKVALPKHFECLWETELEKITTNEEKLMFKKKCTLQEGLRYLTQGVEKDVYPAFNMIEIAGFRYKLKQALVNEESGALKAGYILYVKLNDWEPAATIWSNLTAPGAQVYLLIPQNTKLNEEPIALPAFDLEDEDEERCKVSVASKQTTVEDTIIKLLK